MLVDLIFVCDFVLRMECGTSVIPDNLKVFRIILF